MLDLGFIHALRQISTALPEERQTMLFSATMPKQMAEIAATYLTNPVRIQVNPPGKAADKITQSIHFIAKAEKTNLLVELLADHREEAAIVFVRTKHGADRLMKALLKQGYAADAVHGNKSQGQRERAIAAFRAEETKVLVATDVAARGLDIPIVRHVYNFDLPNVPDNYVHRIGRTARAGMDGAAIAFCAPDEVDELKAIQKTMKFTIPVASGRPWEGAEIEKRKPGGGRGRGGRPGGRSGGRPGGRSGGRSAGKSGGGQGEQGERRGGPGGKPGGKPSGKPGGGGKPGGQRRRNGPPRGRKGGKPGGGQGGNRGS
jgi:ATP-dependent RNA helicase RhlE